MPQDLLTEIFPIEPAQLPQLTAYSASFSRNDGPQVGGRLAYRLNQTFQGYWVWADNHILTDTPVTPVEMDITVDILRGEVPDLYGDLDSITEDTRWQSTPEAVVRFIAWTRVRELEGPISAALSKSNAKLGNALVERDCRVEPYVVSGQPALSLSIQSRILAEGSLADFLQTLDKPKSAIGLWVKDRTGTLTGEIIALSGSLGEHRARLLSLTKRTVMQNILKEAPDDEPVVRVHTDDREYEYPASALALIIRQNHDDYTRFNVHSEHARRVLQLAPSARSNLIKVASNILKEKSIIASAYNSRNHPELFFGGGFKTDLVFGGNRVRPYNPQSLGDDFLKSGLFWRHPRFDKTPIKIAVVNTLEEKIDDFVEALKRQLEKFGFAIELIKERKVRVLSDKNLESAVKVLEKEEPNIVLAFFPDSSDIGDDEADASYSHLKSISLSKGIASHIIRYSTMHNPDAMATIIMAILGKTGSVPFALAEPLHYADALVGLDIVREHKKDHDLLVTMARIYNFDGQLVRYILHQIELDPAAPIPLIVMQTVFPMEVFGDKRVIVHHLGPFSHEEKAVIYRWTNVLKSPFYLVEIWQHRVPRLYALDGGKVFQPAWGSWFKISNYEGLLATSYASPHATPQPLHIRVLDELLPIEDAVHSILAGSLLHYGMTRPPKLPVTLQYADEMNSWLAKGILPSATEGDVPFWL